MNTVPSGENLSPRRPLPAPLPSDQTDKTPAAKRRRSTEAGGSGTKKSQEPPSSGTLAGEGDIERSRADRDNPQELRNTTEPER